DALPISRGQARRRRIAPARGSEGGAGDRAINAKQYQDALPSTSSGATRRGRVRKRSRLVYSYGGASNRPSSALPEDRTAISRGDERRRAYLPRAAGSAE